MSRTAHHTKAFREHFDTKERKNYHWCPCSIYGLHNWSRIEPKWWRKAMKHRKRRAKLREALHKELNSEEDVLYPLDKKPWIYFY